METLIFENELDLALDMSDIKMEGALEVINAIMLECTGDIIVEAAGKFGEKVSKVFDAIKKAIMEFCKKVRDAVNVKITQMEVNKKLKDYKKLLAMEKTLAKKQLTGKGGRITTAKYFSEYTKYINEIVKATKTIANKEYASVDDYISQCVDVYSDIEHKYSTVFSDYEVSVLKISAEYAVKYTEKEMANINNVIKMMEAVQNKAVNEVEKMAGQSENPGQVNCYQKAARKVAEIGKRGVSAVSNHPFKVLATITAVVGTTKAVTTVAKSATADRAAKKDYKNKESYVRGFADGLKINKNI